MTTVPANGHFFANILFMAVKDKICRKSLSRIFVQLSEHHEFGIQKSTQKRLLTFSFLTIAQLTAHVQQKKQNRKCLNYVRYFSMLFGEDGGVWVQKS